MSKSLFDILKLIREYRNQNNDFPVGSFKLNPQGKLISNTHGDINLSKKEKKSKDKDNKIKVLNIEPIAVEPIAVEPIITPLPKKLTCSKCKNKYASNKAKIKSLADANALDSYVCKKCAKNK